MFRMYVGSSSCSYSQRNTCPYNITQTIRHRRLLLYFVNLAGTKIYNINNLHWVCDITSDMWTNVRASFHFKNDIWTMRNFLGQIRVGGFKVSLVLLILTLVLLSAHVRKWVFGVTVDPVNLLAFLLIGICILFFILILIFSLPLKLLNDRLNGNFRHQFCIHLNAHGSHRCRLSVVFFGNA